jgi:hypothetical protein
MSKLKVTLRAMLMIFALLALSSAAFTLLSYYYQVYAQNNNNNINKLSIADSIASGDVTDHSAII